jgi:hypothetical protein
VENIISFVEANWQFLIPLSIGGLLVWFLLRFVDERKARVIEQSIKAETEAAIYSVTETRKNDEKPSPVKRNRPVNPILPAAA